MKRTSSTLSILFWMSIASACGPSAPVNESAFEQAEVVAINADNFRSALILRDLDGNPIDPATYENKTLILNLWATWCGPCIKEMPDLMEMEVALGDDFILLLASDEGESKIKRFISRKGFDLNFIQIENSLESLGVYSLPTTFIVGIDGNLKDTLIGARDWTNEKQIMAIKSFQP